MTSLWPRQETQIGEVRQALRLYQSVLMQSPTGSGKTQMGTHAVRNATEKGNSVIWLAHRRELLEQTGKTFHKAGIAHSVMMGGSHHNPRLRATIASVGTLVNRIDSLAPPKLLIVDECHHSSAASYSKILDWVKAGDGKVLGLTATPWRLSGEGLDDHFEHMVLGPPVSWLIENGYLSDYRAYAPATPDLTGVHTVAGDYVKGEIEQIMTGKAIVADCVSHYGRLAAGKRTIGFAVSIEHSKMLAADFNAAGIPAAHIDAATPSHVRRQFILNFATGHIKVLFNCDLFSEGFDLSAIADRDVPLECVIQARPTKSLTLHLQQVGRALRRKPHPAILIDLCGNLARLGLPDHPHEWTLAGRPKKGRGGKGDEAPRLVRECPSCRIMHAIQLAACPHCGQERATGGRLVEEVAGELREIDREQARRERLREQGAAKSLEQLIELGRAKGYKNPEAWAGHVITARLQRQGRR